MLSSARHRLRPAFKHLFYTNIMPFEPELSSSRFIPRSLSGRLVLASFLLDPVPFAFLVFSNFSRFSGFQAVLWLLSFAPLILLGAQIRQIEERLARLKPPGIPRLFAHTPHGIFISAMLFTTAFSFCYAVVFSGFPHAPYFLRLSTCGYFAFIFGLLGGFLTSSADQLLRAYRPRQ